MSTPLDHDQIPVLWINLNRAHRRRTRMQWALENGGWTAYRFNAVDAEDCLHHFLPFQIFLILEAPIPVCIALMKLNPIIQPLVLSWHV